ncbi:unnamed protein product, partial [Polarella glacialis]
MGVLEGHEECTWYCTRPLDPADKIEEAAKLHFQGLRQKVFDRLGLEFGAAKNPSINDHGRVITELFAIADAGPEEQQKSVIFGL